jgi:hypothetical protein
MSEHKVVVHRWHSGKLNVIERLFEKLEDALGFGHAHSDSHVKIYNSADQLVHQRTNFSQEQSAY